MNSKIVPWIGISLAVIGMIHNLYGLVVGWPVIIDGMRAGFVGAWETGPQQGIFWFLMFGIACLVIGAAAAQSEVAGEAPSKVFIASLVLLTLCNVVPMPATGAWLVLIPIVMALRRRRQAKHYC